MAFWADIDDNDRGWRFYCSRCGGAAYQPQPTRYKRGEKPPKRCTYKYCPNCGAEMTEKDNAAKRD